MQSFIPFLLFINVRIIDLLDILLVALLLYVLYKLIRKTVAMNIFIGILAIYIIWKLVTLVQMELLSDILGQFISVGVIALLIVFQQELRKFLLLLGTPKFLPQPWVRLLSRRLKRETGEVVKNVETVIHAANQLSADRTGALIIMARDNKLPDMIQTGVELNATLSAELLLSIFFKNNPLHDGAVIVDGDRIRAARCILPVSGNKELPGHYGLRHRAGTGISEQSDAIAIMISEETGLISYAIKGRIYHNVTPAELRQILPDELAV